MDKGHGNTKPRPPALQQALDEAELRKQARAEAERRLAEAAKKLREM